MKSYLHLNNKGEILQECIFIDHDYEGIFTDYQALESLKPDSSQGDFVVRKELWEVYCNRQQSKGDYYEHDYCEYEVG